MQDWHDVSQQIGTAAGWLGAAAMGRFLFILREVRKGSRRMVSIKTGIDLAMAAPMGLIAHGACVYFGLAGAPEAAIVAVAGYLGPTIIDRLVDWKLDNSKTTEK